MFAKTIAIVISVLLGGGAAVAHMPKTKVPRLLAQSCLRRG